MSGRYALRSHSLKLSLSFAAGAQSDGVLLHTSSSRSNNKHKFTRKKKKIIAPPNKIVKAKVKQKWRKVKKTTTAKITGKAGVCEACDLSSVYVFVKQKQQTIMHNYNMKNKFTNTLKDVP